jgi:alkylhydroperoxidase family enzyme
VPKQEPPRRSLPAGDGVRSGPRIPYGALDEEQASTVLTRNGEPLNLFRILAHHRRLLDRVTRLGGLFLRGIIPPEDRELVILRSAWATRCEYEFRQHIAISAQLGLDVAQLRSAATGGERGTGRQPCLIDMVDQLVTDDRLSQDAWDALSEHYAPDAILEVIAMAGFYRMLAGILNSVDVEVEADLLADGYRDPEGLGP